MKRQSRTYDLSTRGGRLAAHWRSLWRDQSFVRLTSSNAHWISDEMARANQPWPFQVKMWRDRGVRTIINLRNGFDAHHALEKDACDRYGVKQVFFGVTALEAPSAERILAAKALFDQIEYPAMMHCKSGADRAGLMSVLYLHFRKGVPIAEALDQLSFKFGHMRGGPEGVLDFHFERYLAEAAPQGVSYEDWVRSDAYDPVRLKSEFRAQWWSALITGKLLRREFG